MNESQSSQRQHSPTLLTLLILPLLAIFVALMMLALEMRPQAAATPTFAPAPPRTVLDFSAPDFQLPMLDGVTLVSPGDYAGRPLFLNFWATWCAPCVRELPALEEFAAEHSADPAGPALLTINLGETAAQVEGFLREIGLQNLPVALDINQVVKRDYGVQNLPTTFVIDGEGTVRHMKLGEMTYDQMGIYLDALEQAD
ncbi:MAG: TlpA disulfide reductase family protein [Chloroflexi bacterium]|nr:TlpA disulfide reductase family protein [Chloroflexota bacterium]